MNVPLTLFALWRRQLRDRGPGLLLALLTLATTGYLVAVPGLERAAYDRAIGDRLGDAPRTTRDLQLTYSAGRVQPMGTYGGEALDAPTSPEKPMAATAAKVMGPDVAALLAPPLFSARSVEFVVQTPQGDFFHNPGREGVVRAQAGLDKRVTWDRGQLGPSTKTVTYRDKDPYSTDESGNPVTMVRKVPVIPVALATSVADEWDAKIGDRFQLTALRHVPYESPFPFQVELAATYTPTNPTDPFWSDDARLVKSNAVVNGEGGTSSSVAFLIPPETIPALGQAMEAQPEGMPRMNPTDYARGLNYTWRYGIDPERVRKAAAAETLRTGVSRLRTGGPAWGEAKPGVVTDVVELLDAHDRAVAGTRALIAFVTIALLALGTLAAGLVAAVLAGRRAASARVLAARGGSPGQIRRLVAGEVLWWTLPAAVVAALVAWRVAGRPTAASALAAIPVLVALGTALVLATRAARTGPERSAGLTAPATRVLAELAVLAGAYFAVTTVQARGGEIVAGQVDWYAAMAPVLLALAAAAVVLRAFPLLLRGAARLASRGRAAMGFLGLARASRGGSGALLPLTGLVVAATVATFLASLSASIDQGRAAAAYQATGADLRVDAVRVDPGDLDALRAVPGVRSVVPALVSTGERVTGRAGSGVQAVTVIGVDVPAYAASLAGTPLAFSPSGAGGSVDALTGLTSEPLRPGTSLLEVRVNGDFRKLTTTRVVPALRRATTTATTVPVVMLPWAELLAGQPYLQPNTAFVTGTPEAMARIAADPPVGLAERVIDRRALAAHTAGQALPTLVRGLGIAGFALAGLFSVLALGVTLARTRPERVDALMRMRVLGLRRRRDWLLGALEVVPAACAAILAGVAIGVVLPGVMAKAIDLGPFVGGTPHPLVHTSWLGALPVAAALLLLTLLAVIVDGIRTRSRSLAAHLRGDHR